MNQTVIKKQLMLGAGVAIGSIIFARFIRPQIAQRLGV